MKLLSACFIALGIASCDGGPASTAEGDVGYCINVAGLYTPPATLCGAAVVSDDMPEVVAGVFDVTARLTDDWGWGDILLHPVELWTDTAPAVFDAPFIIQYCDPGCVPCPPNRAAVPEPEHLVVGDRVALVAPLDPELAGVWPAYGATFLQTAEGWTDRYFYGGEAVPLERLRADVLQAIAEAEAGAECSVDAPLRGY